MKIIKLLLIFNSVFFSSFAQKISILPSINLNWAEMVVTPKKYKDITTPYPDLGIALGLEILYKPKKTIFSIQLKKTRIGFGHKLRNSHISDTSLGTIIVSERQSIEQYQILAYGGIESKNFKPFIGKLSLKFSIKTGLGVGFNKSQNYYDNQFKYSYIAYSDAWSFVKQEVNISKKYVGYYFSAMGGVTVFNKKKKKILAANAFYDFGLRKMASFSSNFHYGRASLVNQNLIIDPINSTKLENFITFTRGSTFGISLGIPITIKK